MKIGFFGTVSSLFVLMFANSHAAEILPLSTAMENARKTCYVLFDNVVGYERSSKAAVVSGGVGTALQTGATVVGAVGVAQENRYDAVAKQRNQLTKEIRNLKKTDGEMIGEATTLGYETVDNSDEIAEKETEKKALQQKLRKMNNGPTNGATITKVAMDLTGAFVNFLSLLATGTGPGFSDFVDSVQACSNTINEIPAAVMQYKLDTGVDDQSETVSQALRVVETCGQYDLAKVQKLRGYTEASMIVGAVGVVGGIVGGALSASSISDGPNNSKSDADKDKRLATAGTAVSGVATAASATGLALNAVQLKAVQELTEISVQCAEALGYDWNADVD